MSDKSWLEMSHAEQVTAIEEYTKAGIIAPSPEPLRQRLPFLVRLVSLLLPEGYRVTN